MALQAQRRAGAARARPTASSSGMDEMRGRPRPCRRACRGARARMLRAWHNVPAGLPPCQGKLHFQSLRGMPGRSAALTTPSLREPASGWCKRQNTACGLSIRQFKPFGRVQLKSELTLQGGGAQRQGGKVGHVTEYRGALKSLFAVMAAERQNEKQRKRREKLLDSSAWHVVCCCCCSSFSACAAGALAAADIAAATAPAAVARQVDASHVRSLEQVQLAASLADEVLNALNVLPVNPAVPAEAHDESPVERALQSRCAGRWGAGRGGETAGRTSQEKCRGCVPSRFAGDVRRFGSSLSLEAAFQCGQAAEPRTCPAHAVHTRRSTRQYSAPALVRRAVRCGTGSAPGAAGRKATSNVESSARSYR